MCKITSSCPAWIKPRIGFTLKACVVNRNTWFSHTSLSMADSSKSQTWPVSTFFMTRQWSFFLSPFFSFFLSLTETETALENFFHTVPVHSNEPIVSEKIQPGRSDTEGSREQLWKTGAWLLQRVLARACEMWCVESARDLPGSIYRGPSCVPTRVVK